MNPPALGLPRAISQGSNPLSTFLRSGVPMKPRCYRVMIIRLLLKAIRISFLLDQPSRSIARYLSGPEAQQMWMTFREVVLNYPALEGFDARENTAESARTMRQYCSYDEQYFNRFFSHQEVRTAHYYLTQLLFQASPEQLCAAMMLQCCGQETHTEECRLKWSRLKKYTQEDMIRESGWEPVLPQG